eukprot:TRINITY_DN16764_c0_g1_i6.p2 TRINITY_DN16764_c0_g1~~TRINITY_DN16764_c0_g1_i6.p2  ORF type:complete len:111 (-),score=1.61 TRINITY_DN16764_c0_g1_i6:94-426(-)
MHLNLGSITYHNYTREALTYTDWKNINESALKHQSNRQRGDKKNSDHDKKRPRTTTANRPQQRPQERPRPQATKATKTNHDGDSTHKDPNSNKHRNRDHETTAANKLTSV